MASAASHQVQTEIIGWIWKSGGTTQFNLAPKIHKKHYEFVSDPATTNTCIGKRLASMVQRDYMAIKEYYERFKTMVRVVKHHEGAIPYSLQEVLRWVTKACPIKTKDVTKREYKNLVEKLTNSCAAEVREEYQAMVFITSTKWQKIQNAGNWAREQNAERKWLLPEDTCQCIWACSSLEEPYWPAALPQPRGTTPYYQRQESLWARWKQRNGIS